METEQIDLLVPEVILEQASSGKRLLNYIIDFIVFLIFLVVIGIFIGLFAPSLLDVLDSDSSGFGFMDRIVSMILYGLFMSIIEGLSKGRSLGKLITGTKAVNEDGTPISFSTAFVRGFSRAVPFDGFSALGSPCYPWHDKWAKTYVVDIKSSTLPS